MEEWWGEMRIPIECREGGGRSMSPHRALWLERKRRGGDDSRLTFARFGAHCGGEHYHLEVL
jgi:hypothetical protein